MGLSRRGFLTTSALGALFASLPVELSELLAQPFDVPVVRRNINADDDASRKAREDYRAAVAVLKWRPPHDPTSWIFQANIHGYPPGDFERIFPDEGIPGLPFDEFQRRRALAVQTWFTCKHGPPAFLPWHRVYLFFFERLLGAAINTPDFALPYWDWFETRSLPIAFREPIVGSQFGNALYSWERNPNINDLDPNSVRRLTDFEVSAAFLSEPGLDGRLASPAPGMGPVLEDNPHGAVHIFVGTGLGMGVFEFAARDPAFWCHHCNIDRMWESWLLDSNHRNPNDRTNPGIIAWLDTPSTFVNVDGNAITLTAEQVLATATILGRGYTYYRLVQPPPRPRRMGFSVSAANESNRRFLRSRGLSAEPQMVAMVGRSAPGEVRLGNRPTELAIGVTDSAALLNQRNALAFAPSEGTKTYSLRFYGLSATGYSGDNFGVYINVPPDTPANLQDSFLGGVLNFFTVQSAEHAPAPGQPEFVELDITNVLLRQLASGLWDGVRPLDLTIKPLRGEARDAANIKIERIEFHTGTGI